MPINFTPDLIPRFDETFLRYVNENFQRLKNALSVGTSTHVGAQAPSPAFAGDFWINTNIKAVEIYDGAGWHVLGGYDEHTLWTPTLVQGVTITKTTNYATYIYKAGGWVEGKVLLTPTSNGTAGQIISGTVPVTAASSDGTVIGDGYIYNGTRIPMYSILVSGTFHFIDAARVSGAEQIGQAASNFAGALGVGHSIHWNFRYKYA